MSKREQTARDLEATWRARLAEHARSGLTVREWCAQHGLTQDRFYSWKRRLRASAAPLKACSPFAQVQVTSSARRSGIAIRIGQATIELEPDFDALMLRRVVGALGSERC